MSRIRTDSGEEKRGARNVENEEKRDKNEEQEWK